MLSKSLSKLNSVKIFQDIKYFVIFVLYYQLQNMKPFLIFILLIFSTALFSQNMLLVERPGTVKNYKYFAGDHISLKTKDGVKISGPINIIRDTNLIVDFINELSLSEIETVYKPRRLVQLGSSALIAGSLMYTGLDLLNGGSSGKSFSKNAGLQTSIAILATGLGMQFFTKKKMHIDNEKWRIRILKE